MNTTVWFISFTDREGGKVQKVHTHNCVADYRLINPEITAQEIDCAAVAELIEAAQPFRKDPNILGNGNHYTNGLFVKLGEIRRLDAALARIGGVS